MEIIPSAWLLPNCCCRFLFVPKLLLFKIVAESLTPPFAAAATVLLLTPPLVTNPCPPAPPIDEATMVPPLAMVDGLSFSLEAAVVLLPK